MLHAASSICRYVYGSRCCWAQCHVKVVRSSCCLSVVLHAFLSTSASVLLGVLGFMQSLS